MALVLTMKVGDDFYVKDDQVVVESIESPTAFTLRRMQDNKIIKVVDDGKSVEIFKGVFVSAGLRGQFGLCRVAIEAPRTVALVRGENRHRTT